MNLNELVVAIYARAAMDRNETGTSDLGIAASKVRNNIRHGKAVDPVTGIPALYVPDWAALHAYEDIIGTDEFTARWAAMNYLRQKLYTPLTNLWGNKDYTGMVQLMDEYTSVPLMEDGNE